MFTGKANLLGRGKKHKIGQCIVIVALGRIKELVKGREDVFFFHNIFCFGLSLKNYSYLLVYNLNPFKLK